MVRLVVLLVGFVSSLLLLVAGLGLLEPVQTTIKESAYYSDPPESLFEVITAFESWPIFIERFREVKRAEGEVRFTEKGGATETREYQPIRPPFEFALRLKDSTFARSGDWIFHLQSSSGGTYLTIEDTRTLKNPLSRFWSVYVEGSNRSASDILQGIKKAQLEKRPILPPVEDSNEGVL